MKKKFFSNGGEIVFDRQWWQDVAYDTQQPVIVELMKREVGGATMWCSAHNEECVSSETCGKNCSDYSPCNEICGRCSSLKAMFIGTGKKYRITENGHVRKVKT